MYALQNLMKSNSSCLWAPNVYVTKYVFAPSGTYIVVDLILKSNYKDVGSDERFAQNEN